MNPEPVTSAPPQANSPAAPGAQSPSGTNGTTLSGQAFTKAPSAHHKKSDAPSAAPAPATALAAAPAKKAPPVLDAYLKDLDDTLGLSANEKTEIQNYYLTDAPKLTGILNDPTLSPLQQEQQVADLRDERNAKIEALLEDTDRRHEFFQVEAAYRVALIEAAADGTLVPGAPSPAKTSGAP
jgi:hypothetical protein